MCCQVYFYAYLSNILLQWAKCEMWKNKMFKIYERKHVILGVSGVSSNTMKTLGQHKD